tara:strand:- start:924 stop:2780 length:1857 start_codon:yes stop_codon:yes gene_type:complete
MQFTAASPQYTSDRLPPLSQSSSVRLTPQEKKQNLNDALANLFQWLNNDELIFKIKNENDKGGGKKITVRKYYEDKLADTKQQRKLSQNLSGQDINVPSISIQLNKYTTQTFKRLLKYYSDNFCWMSGIKITDSTGNYPDIPDSQKCIKTSRNVNEDEHAVSFYSMLIFFGGISSVPNSTYLDKFDGYKKALFEMREQGKLDASFQPIPNGGMNDTDKYYYREFINNLERIQKSGGDIGLTTRTYTFSNDLLNLMGLTNNDKARFLSNKQKLNFFGLWPSFCYLNQWKSNFDMYRLGFKIIRRDDGSRIYYDEPYFKPSKTLIDDYVAFCDAIINRRSDQEIEGIKIHRTPYNETPTKGGGRIFFYNRTNKGLVHKYGDEARSNDLLTNNWDMTRAKNNITEILSLLCSIANEFLIDRIFYNCVIVCYLFKYGKPDTREGRQNVAQGRFNRSVVVPLTSQRASMANRREFPSSVPEQIGSEEARREAQSFAENIKRDNIEEYIRSYIDFKGIGPILHSISTETSDRFGESFKKELIPMLIEIMQNKFKKLHVSEIKKLQKKITKKMRSLRKERRESMRVNKYQSASLMKRKTVRGKRGKGKKKKKGKQTKRKLKKSRN